MVQGSSATCKSYHLHESDYLLNDVDAAKTYLFIISQCAVKVIDMPVPSSYNDITQDSNIRDHIGWAWYHRDFFVPKTWKSQRVNIRFGSVNYFAIVVSADEDHCDSIIFKNLKSHYLTVD